MPWGIFVEKAETNNMKTRTIPKDYQHLSPAGAEIRLLMDHSAASFVHCTLKKGKISQATIHQTVREFWYILSGSGAIWRRQEDQESIALLNPKIIIDIPMATQFQYRSDEHGDLEFLCFTTPTWPGSDESRFVTDGPWEPTEP